MSDKKKKGWLDDPRNVNRVIIVLCAICVFLLVAEFLYKKHPYFGFEGWFGFYAFFGFGIFVLIVLAGKYLRKLIKRDEDYYD